MVKGKFTPLLSATFVQVIVGAGLPSAKQNKFTSLPFFTICSPEMFVILDLSLKGKKINKIHKIVRDFIYNTNSDQILSDFRSSNVKVCQLRSQIQSYDSKSNELFTNLHCTSIVDVSVALPHSLLASHRYSPA